MSDPNVPSSDILQEVAALRQHAQEAIEASERQYSTTLDSMVEAIYVVDQNQPPGRFFMRRRPMANPAGFQNQGCAGGPFML